MTRHLTSRTCGVGVDRVRQPRTQSVAFARGLGLGVHVSLVPLPRRAPSCRRRVYSAALQPRGVGVPRRQASRKEIVVHVAAEAISTKSSEIAVDYYSIFKARRVNSAELLKRSYENLLRQVPDAGYSKDTLNARKVLLQRAAETMLDSDKRRAYDQILANNETPAMEVEPRYFAGAMALLQEAGEMAQVVELGTRWLNSNAGSSLCRDVALAVAKAYCDLASITLSSGEGVAFCCEELEAALDLLKACDVAPQLQADISGALKELGPQYILEQLALPEEPEFVERRERGMAQLKELLWEVDEEGGLSPELPDRQGFLIKAREHLTAAQQIELFESCPKDLEMPLDEMYDSAMAYIAEGYRAKWPQLIIKAEKVLQRVQLGSLTAVVGGSDVSVEMGLCSLLLGETDRAMMNLGLRPGSTKPPDKDVIAFVKENSPSEDDLLPGLCALAEVWLKETILPNYKEINMMTSSLGEWFQSPRVSVYLRVLEQGKDLNLVSAVKLSTTVARGISSAVSRTLEGLRNVFRKPRFLEATDSESVGRLKLPKVDISRLSQSPSAVETVSSVSHISTANTLNSLKNSALEEQTEVEQSISDEIPEASVMEVDDYVRRAPRNGDDWWNDERKRVVQERKSSTGVKGYWVAVLVGSGVFLALAAAVNWLPQKNLIVPRSLKDGISRVVQTAKDYFEEEAHGTIDVPLAEELVRRWHIAKSEALGSEHEIDKLAEVLEGNMLRQWKERAHTVQTDGWHWEYTLLDLVVDTVSVGRDGQHATIEANIKEKAELIDSGRKADWYSTSYTVQYDLVMKKQGWRISGARVVYESS